MENLGPIYTTEVLSMALLNLGPRTKIIRHGTCHLHAKICSIIFIVIFCEAP